MPSILSLCLIVSAVLADLYMQSPRGSNNRLNEQTATRTNGNRLFNSQNNNRGGYNVGDKTSTAFDGNNPFYPPGRTFDVNDQTTAMQYQMVFFEGSVLPIEWTSQHGCGGSDYAATVNGLDIPQEPSKDNCNIIVQYMCDTNNAVVTDRAMQVGLRDGGNTNTPDAPNTASQIDSTAQSNANNQRGRQESEAYYYECSRRSRNRGLFTADQNLNGNTAIYTRQNPNANRRGLECDEERDYYPYWKPSPWIDVAYLTNDVNYCPTVTSQSQNTQTLYKCLADFTAANVDNQINAITQAACTAAGGTWTGYTHNVKAPDCLPLGFTRVNHHGNGANGQMVGYNWTLPALTGGGITAVPSYVTLKDDNGQDSASGTYAKCVMRLRYNISTADYDPYNTTSAQNQNTNTGVASPVTQNPTVDVGASLQGLRLAVNTAQFGRTFQDRTHVFYIKKRPAGISSSAVIMNLNVRGKRGNIVETYPAVEYDFVPNQLTIARDQLIHIQWTGSNTHNNGGDGGDGQAGDAGEGRGGTDRHNFALAASRSDNYPIPLDQYPSNFINQTTCKDLSGNKITDGNAANDALSCALVLATSGQFRSAASAAAGVSTFSTTLDNAPASLIGGVVMSLNNVVPGQYDYMCTRNNNFSNRSQKGTITISATPVDLTSYQINK